MTFLGFENLFKEHNHDVVESFSFGLRSQLKILSNILLILDDMAKVFEIAPSDATSKLRVAQIKSLSKPATLGHAMIVSVQAPIGEKLCPQGNILEFEKMERFFKSLQMFGHLHAESVLDRNRAVITPSGECFIPAANGHRALRAISHHALLEDIPFQFDRPI